MKNILIFTCLFSLTAWGQQIQVSNFNLQLKNGAGRISSDHVSLSSSQLEIKLDNYDFDLEQREDQFLVKNHNTSLTLLKLQKDNFILKDLKEITIKNSSLTLDKDLKATSEILAATVKDSSLDLEQVRFNCEVIAQSIMDSCLNNSGISIKTMILPDSISSLDLMEELLGVENFNSTMGPRLKVKNFTTKFHQNRFAGSAAVNVIVDVNFDFSGDVKLDREAKKVEVSNLEVKRGFIPMTTVVLEAIKRANISGVTVVDKKIIISLN